MNKVTVSGSIEKLNIKSNEELIGKPIVRDNLIIGEITSVDDVNWYGWMYEFYNVNELEKIKE